MTTEERLERLVGSFVRSPEEVRVELSERNGSPTFFLSVAEHDRGAVLGRQGSTIKALEVLMTAICDAQGVHPRGIELSDASGLQKDA